METKRVQRKDGSYTNVVADKEDMADAVKSVESQNAVNSININRPVQEGHDLVVVNQDGSQELSDRVPEDALNFVEDVEQKFNGKQSGGGGNFNNAGAKAAAEAQADEALATRGPSTEAELQEAKADTKKSGK